MSARAGDHEEMSLFRESVRGFLSREFKPHIDEWRGAGIIDRSFFRAAGAQGMLCPTVPEQYGGVGGDLRYNVVVVEEVARCGVSPVAFQVHSDVCAHYLLRWGSAEQKARYLPAMVSGERIAAIAMTEPGAGSDLRGLAMSATRAGDGFVLNGSKTFISNGQNADLVIAVARSERGTSLFLVDADAPGFRRGRKLKKMGAHEQDTSELFFDDVRVPSEALLGSEGGGLVILMSELPTERLSLAVAAVAACELALDLTVKYTKERRAFSKALFEMQNTAFKLAELKAEIAMARAYVDACLQQYMAGKFTAVDGAQAKLVTTRLQCRVMDECLQLHGGYGFMDEYLISRLYADARVQRIYGGADEVLKLVISRSL
jgi:acyl-CoA dehydrogenase